MRRSRSFRLCSAAPWSLQPGAVRLRRPAGALGGDPLAAAQICGGAGLRTGQQRPGAAVEQHLAAGGPRPGADVDNPVGGQHQLRVVLHHQQGVAGIAQPTQHPGHPLDVPWVQADTRLVEHEQGVHQSGAQCRGEINALHLAPGQGAGLAVQAQVAEPHLAQIAQAGTDLPQQLIGRLIQGRRQGQAVAQSPAAFDGQTGQVVDIQPGQGPEAGLGLGHGARAVAPLGRQHGVGLSAVAQSPEQALVLQPGPAAVRALVVGPVFGQQHTDVHLVGLGLQPIEEAPHSEPDPLVPGPLALQHPVPLGPA